MRPYVRNRPSQRLAALGRAVLKDVNEAPFPRIQSLLRHPRGDAWVGEKIDVHNSEMLRLLQGLENG